MAKASREIREKLFMADIILEVRDCRIPLTSAAVPRLIQDSSYNRPRLILLNKADLAEPSSTVRAVQYIGKQVENTKGVPVIPFSCREFDKARLSKVLQSLGSLPAKKKFKSLPTKVLVVGVPNVGKSSIINMLQRFSRSSLKSLPIEHTIDDKGLAKVGKSPGVTRSLNGFVVSHNPYLYMFDSPGVMYPRIESEANGMRLIVTGCIRDHSVDCIAACEFLLTFLLERNHLAGLNSLGVCVDSHEDDPHSILCKVARRIGAFQQLSEEERRTKQEKLDFIRASLHILKKFREGSFGRLTLDPIEY
eukprot:jgi/Galph1/441/GphlegSOOS_G5154.1